MQRILMIDDSVTLKEAVKSITSDLFEIVLAENGLDGLNKLKSDTDFALILLDINMPVMTGFEFLPHYNKLGLSIPVVIVTTETSNENLEFAKKQGVKAWIKKPFKKEDLLYVINRVLNLPQDTP